MSNQTTETPFDETDEAEAAPAKKAAGRPKAKVKKKISALKAGRKSAMTDAFWQEIRALYEGGEYSQRDLVVYAETRGIIISQARISQKAVDEGWVKGSRAQEIRDAVHKELKDQIGAGIAQMLNEHRQLAKLAIGECYQHLRVATEQRRVNPDYLIPAALMRQVIGGLNEAMSMEARAMGFDYKTGKPFNVTGDSDGEGGLTKLDVSVMTPTEEKALREAQDKAFTEQGFSSDDEE